MLQVVDVVGGVGTVTVLDALFGLRLDAARWEGIGSWRRHRREAKNAALRIRGALETREGVGRSRPPRRGFI